MFERASFSRFSNTKKLNQRDSGLSTTHERSELAKQSGLGLYVIHVNLKLYFGNSYILGKVFTNADFDFATNVLKSAALVTAGVGT